MFPADLVKHVPRAAGPAFGYIVQALPDAFEDVGTRCQVEQLLVGRASCTTASALPLTVRTSQNPDCYRRFMKWKGVRGATWNRRTP